MAKVIVYNPNGQMVFTSAGRVVEPHSFAAVSSTEVTDLVDQGTFLQYPYSDDFLKKQPAPTLPPEKVAARVAGGIVDSDGPLKSSSMTTKRASRKAKE